MDLSDAEDFVRTAAMRRQQSIIKCAQGSLFGPLTSSGWVLKKLLTLSNQKARISPFVYLVSKPHKVPKGRSRVEHAIGALSPEDEALKLMTGLRPRLGHTRRGDTGIWGGLPEAIGVGCVFEE